MAPCKGSIDWHRVILDLYKLGYTYVTIGMAVGVAKSTVNGWKNDGARPRFEEGDALIGLWASVTGNSRETVHKVR